MLHRVTPTWILSSTNDIARWLERAPTTEGPPIVASIPGNNAAPARADWAATALKIHSGSRKLRAAKSGPSRTRPSISDDRLKHTLLARQVQKLARQRLVTLITPSVNRKIIECQRG